MLRTHSSEYSQRVTVLGLESSRKKLSTTTRKWKKHSSQDHNSDARANIAEMRTIKDRARTREGPGQEKPRTREGQTYIQTGPRQEFQPTRRREHNYRTDRRTD